MNGAPVDGGGLFAAPAYLLGLVLVPLLGLAFAAGARAGRRRLHALVGETLAPRLTSRPPAWVGVTRAACVLLFLTFALVALARPRWGRELTELRTRGVDVLALVDVSRSMDVRDVPPSRLGLARAFVGALAERSVADRFGVVAFAGSAHLLLPLTIDTSAADLFLELLDVGLVPRRGTDLGGAIHKGLDVLARSPGRGVLVIVSDGESLTGDPLGAAGRAAEEGVVIHALGVGTPGGQPVPIRGEDGEVEEYQKDAGGKIVTSRLDEKTLTAVAEATGGRYLPLAAGPAALAALRAEIGRGPAGDAEAQQRPVRPERFQIPLALAVAALLLQAVLGWGVPAAPPAPVRRSGVAGGEA